MQAWRSELRSGVQLSQNESSIRVIEEQVAYTSISLMAASPCATPGWAWLHIGPDHTSLCVSQYPISIIVDCMG